MPTKTTSKTTSKTPAPVVETPAKRQTVAVMRYGIDGRIFGGAAGTGSNRLNAIAYFHTGGIIPGAPRIGSRDLVEIIRGAGVDLSAGTPWSVVLPNGKTLSAHTPDTNPTPRPASAGRSGSRRPRFIPAPDVIDRSTPEGVTAYVTACKAEAALERAWVKAGSPGNRPATPNLDHSRQSYDGRPGSSLGRTSGGRAVADAAPVETAPAKTPRRPRAAAPDVTPRPKTTRARRAA